MLFRLKNGVSVMFKPVGQEAYCHSQAVSSISLCL